jgi:hypothetical protein
MKVEKQLQEILNSQEAEKGIERSKEIQKRYSRLVSKEKFKNSVRPN